MKKEKRKITFASNYEMEGMEELASDFFKRIFDMDYSEMFVSDESHLSDFCGVHFDEEQAVRRELYEEEKERIKTRIFEIYGVTPESNVIFEILKQIKDHEKNRN